MPIEIKGKIHIPKNENGEKLTVLSGLNRSREAQASTSASMSSRNRHLSRGDGGSVSSRDSGSSPSHGTGVYMWAIFGVSILMLAEKFYLIPAGIPISETRDRLSGRAVDSYRMTSY
ncbi:hypothetical protein BTUL_0043g00050 [Botrytis tulipae]|uniref:Uncharacterized protein n=1 Tax=Botrytis tulipae TaxID=87230 RepID=A0A4Z1EW40_9HELO|nr:hypothetical protein BTUL_0043g00050 [Botrytis tulipae]